jgi:hypothetical protein
VESEKSLSLFNADKVILILFVGFLFSPQAQDLLYNSGLRWAYLLLLSFGLAYIATPIVHLVAHKTGAIDTQGAQGPRNAHGIIGGSRRLFSFCHNGALQL